MAVRSSTTWEDGITSAHAGETVTVLDVEGPPAVLQAIDACLKGAAASDHGTAGDLAILIQRMVPSEYAGVAFTADPLTGDREVVRIGATTGLGNAFVSGEVTGIDVTLKRGPDGDLIAGDPAGIGQDVLHDVARLARRVDAHQRMPQDIEWAYHAGVVHLVQARPITVLPVRPRLPEGKGWDKDVAHYPEPVTPFGFSAEQSTAPVVAEVFIDLGMLVKGLEARLVGGEVYARPVPAFGRPGDAAPPAWVLGALSRLLPPLRTLTKRARTAIDDNLYSRWIEQYEQVERTSHPAKTAALRAVDLTELSDRDLADHATKLVEHASAGQRVHFRIGLAGFEALHALHQLVGSALGWDDAAIATMLVGHSPATRASEAALTDLRARLRASEAATVALTQRPQQPVTAIANVNPAMASDLERWIDEHGWGCVNYDAGAPVLAERPADRRLGCCSATLTSPTTRQQTRPQTAPEPRSPSPSATPSSPL